MLPGFICGGDGPEDNREERSCTLTTETVLLLLVSVPAALYAVIQIIDRFKR
jgi:hypothetical protein